MSVFGLPNGAVGGTRVTLAGTSATTLVDAANKNIVVTGILLVNHSGSSRAPVIDLYDGSTAYRVRDDASLADQATEDVKMAGGQLRMTKGDKLRITSDTGLTAHVVYMDMTASRQPT